MKTSQRASLLFCMLLLGSLSTVFNAGAQRYLRDPSFQNNQPTTDGSTRQALVLQNQPDLNDNGKILVGGAAWNYGTANSGYIVRINANGTLDGNFATITTDGTGGINVMVEQPDGRVIVGGSFSRLRQGGTTYFRGGSCPAQHQRYHRR